MSNAIVRIVAAAAWIAAASNVLTAQDSRPAASDVTEETAAAIDAVFKDWSAPDAPGAVVGLYRGGRPVYLKGYGAANLEHSVPMTPDVRFDIASTSKQFTAACIALLILDGAIELDDPLRKHVPSLPEWAETTTIRHCLLHTSGIRDYIGLMTLAGVDDFDHTYDAEALAMIARQTALSFPPGSRHEYSNSGYFLLSHVVKSASKKSLAAFAAERLFVPLGMEATAFVDSCMRVVPRRATAYAPKGKGFVLSLSNWEQTGDGAVVTTVGDLSKWVANFSTGAVGGAAFLDLMNRRGSLDDGTAIDYGFGLMHHSSGKVRGVSHAGGWAGYRAELMRLPDEDLACAVLANRGDADPTIRVQRVLKIAREAGLGSVPPPPTEKPEPRAASRSTSRASSRPKVWGPKTEEVAPFAGHYRSAELDARWTLAAERLLLKTTGPGAPQWTLLPTEPDTFALPGVTLRFARDAIGRPTSFVVSMRGLEGLMFKRVDG